MDGTGKNGADQTGHGHLTPPPSTAARHDVTLLLDALAKGDSKASSELLPLVYDELRKLARARMAKEPAGGAGFTLQPTALVHEAYLRLIGGGGGPATSTGEEGPRESSAKPEPRWDNRGHFFAAAALAMRRILVERARARSRLKRGGGARRVELDDHAMAVEPPPDELIALDEALDKLEKFDRRKYQVVMLRYFAGLSIEECAAAIGISPATVKNDWTFSRAWLHREVASDAAAQPDADGAGG